MRVVTKLERIFSILLCILFSHLLFAQDSKEELSQQAANPIADLTGKDRNKAKAGPSSIYRNLPFIKQQIIS